MGIQKVRPSCMGIRFKMVTVRGSSFEPLILTPVEKGVLGVIRANVTIAPIVPGHIQCV